MAGQQQPGNRGKGVGIAVGLVLASALLMAHLHKWEEGPKRQLTVYADTLANGLPTVCMGLTRHITTTPIILGERWSEEKCDREERAAVLKVQHQLLPCFRITPPQSVFDMATGHAWNQGAGATCGSAAMKAWNRGDWALGCRRIARADSGHRVWAYTKTGRTLANGRPEMKFVPGLGNRRDDEARICMENVQ